MGDGTLRHNGARFIGEGYDIGCAVVPELENVLCLFYKILDVYQTVQTHGQQKNVYVELAGIHGTFGVELQMRAEQGYVYLVLTVALGFGDKSGIVAL